MVSFDGYADPDLKFVNTSAAPVVLRATVSGLELKLSIVGIPVLDDGSRSASVPRRYGMRNRLRRPTKKTRNYRLERRR